VRDLKTIGREGGLGGGTPLQSVVEGIQRLPLAFAELEVPVIASVNGPSIGAECDLAGMYDIRIAAKSARFAESFLKIGLIP
jgi:enoyl-CoA hydratase/carnithine racemase